MSRPPRATRTVDEVAGPYANYLLAVPAAGPDTCQVCHGAVYDGYRTCYPCNQAAEVLGAGVADLTSFVSLAPAGEQFARELYTYKRDSVPIEIRGPRLIGLAAVLWKWLSIHERCLLPSTPVGPPASAAGDQPRFDLVTSVPSTSGRDGVHPLRTLVRDIVDGAADRYGDVLRVARTDLSPRDQAADRYTATREVRGLRVLAVDDTWTTGAHAQSASAALKAAGARHVTTLALGRWFTTDYRDNRQWLTDKRSAPWDWHRCPTHRSQ